MGVPARVQNGWMRLLPASLVSISGRCLRRLSAAAPRVVTTSGRRRYAALAAVAALGLVACGGSEDVTKAHVRLVNAADSTAYPTLELNVDGVLRQGGVSRGGSADYADVDPSKTASTITAPGSATVLRSFTPTVSKKKHYTVLAYGGAGALTHQVLDDNVAEPASGHTSVRVINGAADAGDLDIYITGTSDALTNAVAAQSAAGYGELGSAIDVTSGTWRLRVTAAGDKNDLRLDIPSFTLGSQQVVTLVLTPSRGGTLVHALQLVQEGGIATLDGTQARARVLAGVTNSGAVTATLGSTTLATGVGSPVVGSYVLVSAGSTAPAISVNGNSVGSPSTALVAGGDYTLLVYGALASPVAAWVEDQNQLPTASGKARVRLVNATAGIAGALSLAVDGLSLASGVAAGTASSYGLATSNSAAALSVTAVGVSQSLYSATSQTLSASSNYSVFVVGAQGATSGLLLKDR